MLKFTYRGRTVAYMARKGATLDQVRAARLVAAGMAGTDVTRVRIVCGL